MDFGTKKSLPFVFLILTGILAVLLLGWPFVAGVPGYEVITLWGWGIFYLFASLFQMFVLINVLLLLIVGIWGWLNAIGKAKELKIGKWGLKTIGEFLFTFFVALVMLVLLFLTIASRAITFGLILYLLVVLSAFITYLVFRKKSFIEPEGLFACIQINKKAGNSNAKKGESVEVKMAEDEGKKETKPSEESPVKEEYKQAKPTTAKKGSAPEKENNK